MSESPFNKIVGLQACNFIKKTLQHRCFPMSIAKFSRRSILKNTCRGCFRKVFRNFYLDYLKIHCKEKFQLDKSVLKKNGQTYFKNFSL